jgi:GntR family transcriptional regulator
MQVRQHVRMEVDRESPQAPYRQVAEVLKGRIISGQYRSGSRLPSIQDLVQEFGIARTTANKALRLLESEGLAELSPGMGFYVSQTTNPPSVLTV